MRVGLTWLIYIVCVVLAVDGLAWLTWRTVQAERSSDEAQARVIHQQRVQLALWRLDSALAWLLRAESGRAVEQYRPFTQDGGQLAASPLLAGARPPIRLHLRWSPGDGWTSPQVPTGEDRAAAESMGIDPGRIEIAARWLADVSQRLPDDPRADQMSRHRDEMAMVFEEPQPAEEAAKSASNELRARRQAAVLNQQTFDEAESVQFGAPLEDLIEPIDASGGGLRAQWLDVAGGETALVLLRDVRLGGQRGVVGVWVDWASLQATLTGEVVDLLPAASLVPLSDTESAASDRLAMIPARVVAPMDGTEIETGWGGLSAATWGSIATSWSAVLAAVLAVGVVLAQVLALSTRRARFASAVSHELRTPLTSLRLQADLMPREDPRAGVMRDQVGRLEAIVESVLAYAGIKRSAELQAMSVGELLDRIAPDARARVERADGTLTIESQTGVRSSEVRCDPTLVQRIMVNLVDNACEHAKTDRPLELRITASDSAGRVEITVADNGPGIAGGERKRVFKPFVGGDRGGLGLGLPLARDAADQMGGRLTLSSAGGGAAFVLTLRKA